ncbi:ABC transporter ATP-binding protein [Candidatus Halobeggiatoa sp. HSG11]|nr:ABC transporter ATP-binding protein [Candidatus Halobeggiatoa sp. HSG11]
MDILKLQQVGVKIEERWLVRKISIILPSKKLTVIIGPNGAGKTTLLKLLAGLWKPTEGIVTLNDINLQKLQRVELAKRLTLVPQTNNINFAFTVQDIVMMGRNPHLKRFQPVIGMNYVKQAMEKTDISHLADRLVTKLSGGEMQRVIIARSLATQANIILLDEPTASLDISHTIEILELLKELVADGHTVILSIHDINLAVRYADNIVVLNQGDIIDNGLPHQVLTNEMIKNIFKVDVEKITTNEGKMMFFFK